jgi:hypothetical protein
VEKEKSYRLYRESKRDSLAYQPVTFDWGYCVRNVKNVKKRMNGKENNDR